MKKSLLALAVLGAFAGIASAQSSVTIYGIVDANLGKDIGSDDKRMGQGAQSRLGFRGTEDLGGGLSAYFLFEHRFKPADGGLVNPASFWQGSSLVGLRGGFGSVSLGRTYTTSFLGSQLRADPWGFDTVAANTAILTGGTGSGTAATGLATVRNASAITYNFAASGFTFGAQIAEGDKNGGDEKAWNLAGGYKAGPITVGVSYESTATDGKWATINGAYDLGMVKLGAFLGKGETGDNADRKSYLLTATAPIAGGELRASFGELKGQAAAGGADVKIRRQAGLGYFYPLSKRTTVYANVATAKTDLAFGNGDDSDTGYDFGIKHTF